MKRNEIPFVWQTELPEFFYGYTGAALPFEEMFRRIVAKAYSLGYRFYGQKVRIQTSAGPVYLQFGDTPKCERCETNEGYTFDGPHRAKRKPCP